jgi:hypothetical protein
MAPIEPDHFVACYNPMYHAEDSDADEDEA